MESHRPIIYFEISYAGEQVFCDAVMEERSYEIFFDGLFKCELANFENDWQILSGAIVPKETVDQIGLCIEDWLE